MAISTDVIVGFPGETEEQAERTRDLLAACRFDVVHTACYSPREGTVSATWDDDVPHEVKEERRRRVEALQEEVARIRNQAVLGATVEVLIEDPNPCGAMCGSGEGARARGNLSTSHVMRRTSACRLVAVRIEKSSPWALQGSPV